MDARTGRLRLRVMLPEKLSMLAANVDGLRGRLLAIDENGQRIFALTASGLTVVQLARVPLGLGTISPASASSAGGTALMMRGGGFQNGANVTLGRKDGCGHVRGHEHAKSGGACASTGRAPHRHQQS